MTPIDVLREARATLSKGWCRLNLGMKRDKWLKSCSPDDPAACYHCLLGAMFAQFPGYNTKIGWATFCDQHPVLKEAVKILASRIPGTITAPCQKITGYNDSFEYSGYTCPQGIYDLIDRGIHEQSSTV